METIDTTIYIISLPILKIYYKTKAIHRWFISDDFGNTRQWKCTSRCTETLAHHCQLKSPYVRLYKGTIFHTVWN